MIINETGFNINGLRLINISLLIKLGIETMNIELAGVGNPSKWSVTESIVLNFAKRKADPKVIKNPINARGAIEKIILKLFMLYTKLNSLTPDKKNNWYIIMPGTNPEVIISDKESRYLPISDSTFNNLAKNPSRKSKIIPSKQKTKQAEKKWL